MLRTEFDGEKILADFNLTVGELERARKFGLGDALRALQPVARREIGKATNLRSRSITRRVRIYPRRGRLWIGAGNAPLVTSYADVSIVPIRRRRRGELGEIPRAVVDRGSVLEGVFVRRINQVNVPLRGVRGTRSVEAVRRPYGPEAEQAFDKVVAAAPPIIDRAFRAAAERVIRARS